MPTGWRFPVLVFTSRRAAMSFSQIGRQLVKRLSQFWRENLRRILAFLKIKPSVITSWKRGDVSNLSFDFCSIFKQISKTYLIRYLPISWPRNEIFKITFVLLFCSFQNVSHYIKVQNSAAFELELPKIEYELTSKPPLQPKMKKNIFNISKYQVYNETQWSSSIKFGLKQIQHYIKNIPSIQASKSKWIFGFQRSVIFRSHGLRDGL